MESAKYVAKEKIELAKALVRASEKAAQQQAEK